MDIAVPVSVEAHCRLRGRLRSRFVEPDVEEHYRSWRADLAVPFARVAMAASLANWFIACVAGFAVSAELGRFLTTVHVIANLPIVGGLLLLTRYPALHRRIILAAAVVNGVSGVVAVLTARQAGILLEGARYADIGTLVAVLYVIFGCMILRLPPVTALVAMAPYVLVQQVFIVREFRPDAPRLALFSVLMWGAVMSGLWVSAALERTLRSSFRQERQIEAQQRVIAMERERSERLLHSILPQSVAEELKSRPGTIAEAHDDVTVLFADLCGFTPLAARLSATELVELLNEVFMRFDELCARHGVEKIKTIGDAYMAVAGVPRPRADHVEACAELALAMREAVRELAASRGDALDFRIGMHRGPVIAGVIGSSKFAYDLWGDTVNTAARMESHGVPGEIQVTAEVAERLRERGYTLRERGLVEVKGKGSLPVWLLDTGPGGGRGSAVSASAAPAPPAR